MPVDYRFGQLSAGVTALDTTLTASNFATLSSALSTTQYVPITIADDSAGVYEIVWATAHAASSQTITVVRGREGTTARAWSSGATWRVAPTSRDVVSTSTRAGLPADAHIGMRVSVTDEAGQVVEKTSGGWVAPFGYGYARRSEWTQSSGGLVKDTMTLVSGLGAVSGKQNSPATFNGGTATITLNAAGVWHISFSAYCDPDGPRSFGLYATWTNGPWGNVAVDIRSSAGTAYGGYARLTPEIDWTGYVTSAQAAGGISLQAWTNFASGLLNPLTGIGYGFTAELLGG